MVIVVLGSQVMLGPRIQQDLQQVMLGSQVVLGSQVMLGAQIRTFDHLS